MPLTEKQRADAQDRLLDAAYDLADLIEGCGIELDEYVLEELAIYLAENAKRVRKIILNVI